ncbi:nucleotidyltransferase domain-containing protein [Glycomyces arizonensis]|uniref:nucleotidyltransferase domain-containing protein n=1 Tax=Glycomyces arizonensis TaxID=256035 RepID=UPI00047BB841|nr:nucleotidyltransferase domain-containing protein [Glycomyces arizonensis]
MDHTRGARAIAETTTAALTARAVALTGSIAAGTDHPDSDIDLIAVADAPGETEIRSVEGRMVTIEWKTIDEVEAAFTRPWEAGAAVPGWRTAHLLSDPEGLLARVKASAETWNWHGIAAEADRWAADGIVGLAEEVHKVCGMLGRGNPRAAAANRAILALQLPGILAAADRILYRTENDLWDLVCEAEGEAWASAWDTATGTVRADPAEACRAGLRLYLIAAGRLDHVFTQAQRPVVETACRLAQRRR